MMRRFIACLMFVGLMIWPAVSWSQVSVWDAAFEADPAAGDPVSEGDDHIRQTKENVRYRTEVESWVGDTGDADDNGLNRIGSARTFMNNAAPTTLYDGISDFDNTGGAGETDLDDTATNGAVQIDKDVGHGRLWVDLDGPDGVGATDDDNTLMTFVGVAGDGNGAWAAVVANSPYEASDDEILAGSYNLIYNGSFEATNGTGDPTVGPALFAVSGPDGWADGDVTTPHYSYTNASTDIRYGDGYHLVLTNFGAANEAVQQTITNLNAGSIYKVIARVQDDGAAANVLCRLDVLNEGGAVFVAQDSSNDAGPVWETLSGTFGTAAIVDTVDIVIYAIGANGQNCKVDHVAVYEIGDVGTDRDEISEPGAYRLRGEYPINSGDIICGAGWDAGNCSDANTGLIVTVTPPSVGTQIIMLDASASISSSAAGTTCYVRLRDKTNAVTLDTGLYIEYQSADTTLVRFHASVIDQVPGATVEYALQVREDAPAAGDCTIEAGAADFSSWIDAVIIPTR